MGAFLIGGGEVNFPGIYQSIKQKLESRSLELRIGGRDESIDSQRAQLRAPECGDVGRPRESHTVASTIHLSITSIVGY
jgi:hypothetical protein